MSTPASLTRSLPIWSRGWGPGIRDKRTVPSAAVAIQTFGDFLGFKPQLHIFISDGCFHASDLFTVAPAFDTKALEKIFRHKVLKMLLAKGKITADLIALMDKWRHSGFNVYKGEQMVRYYGYYSNVSRGRRKKANTDELIPTVLEPELTSKAFRRNWARLIQKIAACLGPDPGKLTL